MADSRRINTNIREEESKLSEEEQPPLSLSSLILSSEFWPPLKEEKLELPPLVVQAMEAYTHRYEKLKVHVFLLDVGTSPVNAGGFLRIFISFVSGHEDAELEASSGFCYSGRGAGGPHPHQPDRLPVPSCHYPALPGKKYELLFWKTRNIYIMLPVKVIHQLDLT